MFNYKSVFVQPIKDPIVISFNKENNKNYRVGFTVNQEDSDYDRSVVVLEDNIHWKSDLTREISTIKKDGLTYMYNCGDKIFNEYLYIMPNPQAQTIDTSSKSIVKNVFGIKTIYQNHYNVDLETVDTKHTAYITYSNDDYTPSSNDTIFNHEDKSYIKKDFKVTPIILESNRHFLNPYIIDDETCVISLECDTDDLILISTDYEIEVDQNKEKISSIVTMDEDEPHAIYYDRIKTDNVRFVISDYGRLISLAQFTEDYYKDSLVMVFSDNKYKTTETASLRIGFDYYNTVTDVTSNF